MRPRAWFSSGYQRIFETVPELDKADKRSGATFVNILFGLVVTETAIQLSRELVNWSAAGWQEVDETRISHLLVAMTLTVLSWIGYHASQQYPPFLIKFLNLPFLQFFLDVSMVVTYYVVVALAETSGQQGGASLTPDARPEAALILVAFALYSAWDWSGYRLFRDREYARRLQSPREPATGLDPRRKVTFIFTAISLVIAATVWKTHPRAPGTVIATDVVLIAMLFCYRLAKQASDPNVLTRGQMPPITQRVRRPTATRTQRLLGARSVTSTSRSGP